MAKYVFKVNDAEKQKGDLQWTYQKYTEENQERGEEGGGYGKGEQG